MTSSLHSISFVLLLLVVLGMAVGVIAGRPAIKGSCGGLGNVGINKACDCDNPCDRKKKQQGIKLNQK